MLIGNQSCVSASIRRPGHRWVPLRATLLRISVYPSTFSFAPERICTTGSFPFDRDKQLKNTLVHCIHFVMDPGFRFPGIEMNSLENPATTDDSQSFSGSRLPGSLEDDSSMPSNLGRDDQGQSRRMSQHSNGDALLPGGNQTGARAAHIVKHEDEEPKKIAMDGRSWVAFLYCIPHAIPCTITIIILYQNVREVYWQDLGYPRQSSILQAFQYGVKAHEVIIAASLTAIVVHHIQHDLSCSEGVPFEFLTTGFRLDEPL